MRFRLRVMLSLRMRLGIECEDGSEGDFTRDEARRQISRVHSFSLANTHSCRSPRALAGGGQLLRSAVSWQSYRWCTSSSCGMHHHRRPLYRWILGATMMIVVMVMTVRKLPVAIAKHHCPRTRNRTRTLKGHWTKLLHSQQ